VSPSRSSYRPTAREPGPCFGPGPRVIGLLLVRLLPLFGGLGATARRLAVLRCPFRRPECGRSGRDRSRLSARRAESRATRSSPASPDRRPVHRASRRTKTHCRSARGVNPWRPLCSCAAAPLCFPVPPALKHQRKPRYRGDENGQWRPRSSPAPPTLPGFRRSPPSVEDTERCRTKPCGQPGLGRGFLVDEQKR
jgi:hypothetical protein